MLAMWGRSWVNCPIRLRRHLRRLQCRHPSRSPRPRPQLHQPQRRRHQRRSPRLVSLVPPLSPRGPLWCPSREVLAGRASSPEGSPPTRAAGARPGALPGARGVPGGPGGPCARCPCPWAGSPSNLPPSMLSRVASGSTPSATSPRTETNCFPFSI